VNAEELVGAAGVAVAALALLYLAVLAVVTRPRSPRASEPTMELGDEPPAVVDLLTDDFEPTPEAVPATLLDLAARRWLAIEQYGEADLLIRVRSGGQGALRPFEEQVLMHVRGLAVDGTVPAAAMTTGPEAASAAWWKRFRTAVIAEARDRGLCRARWPARALTVAFVGGAAALACAWGADHLAGEPAPSTVEGLAFGAGAGGILTLGVASALAASDRQRETEAGLAAGGRWLGVRRYLADHGDFATKPAAAVAVWDRYLAHAAALDLATLAVAQLPLGAEDDRHAWSRASGQWRQVVVGYPRLRPGYGQHPLFAVFTGLLAGVVAGVVAVQLADVATDSADWVDDLPDRAGPWVRGVGAGLLALAVVVAVWSALKVAFGVVDLFTRRPVEGLLLRARVWNTTNDNRRRHYLAVDDGTAPRVRAWRVKADRYGAASQGARVRATVTPRLGFVHTVETTAVPWTAGAPPGAVPIGVPDGVSAGDDPALVAAATRLVEIRGRADPP
jgi:hypothetical protein